MVDWESVDDNIAREIVRNGEQRIQAQLTTALASDQRAMTFAAVMAAISTVVLGASISILTGDQPNYEVGVPGLVAGLGFLVSLGLAVLSARPIEFVLPGNYPGHLYGSQKYIDGPLSRSLGWDCENYQKVIDDNHTGMKRNGQLLTWAIRSTFFAPALGVIAWLIILPQ